MCTYHEVVSNLPQGCVPLNYAILLFAYLLSLPFLVALHSTLSLNSGMVTLSAHFLSIYKISDLSYSPVMRSKDYAVLSIPRKGAVIGTFRCSIVPGRSCGLGGPSAAVPFSCFFSPRVSMLRKFTRVKTCFDSFLEPPCVTVSIKNLPRAKVDKGKNLCAGRSQTSSAAFWIHSVNGRPSQS